MIFEGYCGWLLFPFIMVTRRLFPPFFDGSKNRGWSVVWPKRNVFHVIKPGIFIPDMCLQTFNRSY